MKKQKGFAELASFALLILCVGLIVYAVVSTDKKQAADHQKFMSGCLQEKKQYECDVLWNQTAESKQNRDLALSLAAGAAIGAAAGRK